MFIRCTIFKPLKYKGFKFNLSNRILLLITIPKAPALTKKQ